MALTLCIPSVIANISQIFANPYACFTLSMYSGSAKYHLKIGKGVTLKFAPPGSKFFSLREIKHPVRRELSLNSLSRKYIFFP